jgi:3-oxoacid CoA-transferase subunit A
VGTLVAEGKELREFDGHTYVMERSLVADVAAWSRPTWPTSAATCAFNLTARNFNPACAMAGKVCIVAEVERIVEVGELAPDDIHLPGIYVHRIVRQPEPRETHREAHAARDQ